MSNSHRQALAYLLTWTTYGTWLRGDKRGYVGRTLAGGQRVAPMRNQFGTPYDADDGRMRNLDASALKSEAVYLTQEQAICVAEALCELADRAGYELLRASVMLDHVHLVVSAHLHGKNEIMRRFKSVAAVRLTQRFGHPPAKAGGSCDEGSCGVRGRWWTKDGSKREKWDEEAVAAAVDYVARQKRKLAEVVDGRVIRTVVGD